MRHAQEIIFDIFALAFAVIGCLAVIGRFAVFAYWHVRDAWTKEATAEWIDDNTAETKNMETFGK